jgi:hypothetical protein
MDVVCKMWLYMTTTSQCLTNTTRLCSSARTTQATDAVLYSSLDILSISLITEDGPIGIRDYNEQD